MYLGGVFVRFSVRMSLLLGSGWAGRRAKVQWAGEFSLSTRCLGGAVPVLAALVGFHVILAFGEFAVGGCWGVLSCLGRGACVYSYC